MSNLSGHRPSPAMIVAASALVVATAGGAFAGGTLLTGANIRNNSLTGLDIKDGTVAGVDVKNGTLRTVDLSPAAVASLRGQKGPAGPAGPAGPSAAFHVDSGNEVLPWNNLEQVVATLPLPAGDYVVFGKVLAGNDNAATPATITCSMALGGTTIDSAPGRTLAEADTLAGTPGDREYVPLSGRGSLPAPGAATITCTSGSFGSFMDRHIEAIRVGSLP